MKIEIGFSSSFKRAFKKRINPDQECEKLFWKKVEVFITNPHDPSLKTHKLSGTLEGLSSFSINYVRHTGGGRYPAFYFMDSGWKHARMTGYLSVNKLTSE